MKRSSSTEIQKLFEQWQSGSAAGPRRWQIRQFQRANANQLFAVIVAEEYTGPIAHAICRDRCRGIHVRTCVRTRMCTHICSNLAAITRAHICMHGTRTHTHTHTHTGHTHAHVACVVNICAPILLHTTRNHTRTYLVHPYHIFIRQIYVLCFRILSYLFLSYLV